MATGKVVLTADTTALQTGLTRAQGYVKSFAASASSSLVGLFAFGAVVGQFNALRNELDRIGKLSQRGFSTDFLQDLSATASLAGASLEQAVKGFSKLVGEVNRAGPPTAELRDGLSQIGLTVEDLRGLSPEQVFEIVAKRIGSLTNESEQLGVVTAVLGSRYADLVPLLNQYADSGLESVIKASAEQIKRTEEFNDSLTRLSQTLKGVMVPVLDIVTKAFAVLQGSMAAMGATFAGILNLGEKLASGMKPSQAIKEAWAEVREEIEKAANAAWGNPGATGAPSGPPGATGGGMAPDADKAAREQAMLDTQKRASDETERRLKAEKEIEETRRKMAQEAEEAGKSDIEIAEIRLRRARELRMNARMGSGADKAEAEAEALGLEADAQSLLLRAREQAQGAAFSPTRANVSEIQRIGGGGGVGTTMDRVVQINEKQAATLERIEAALQAIRTESGGF